MDIFLSRPSMRSERRAAAAEMPAAILSLTYTLAFTSPFRAASYFDVVALVAALLLSPLLSMQRLSQNGRRSC